MTGQYFLSGQKIGYGLVKTVYDEGQSLLFKKYSNGKKIITPISDKIAYTVGCQIKANYVQFDGIQHFSNTACPFNEVFAQETKKVAKFVKNLVPLFASTNLKLR